MPSSHHRLVRATNRAREHSDLRRCRERERERRKRRDDGRESGREPGQTKERERSKKGGAKRREDGHRSTAGVSMWVVVNGREARDEDE